MGSQPSVSGRELCRFVFNLLFDIDTVTSASHLAYANGASLPSKSKRANTQTLIHTNQWDFIPQFYYDQVECCVFFHWRLLFCCMHSIKCAICQSLRRPMVSSKQVSNWSYRRHTIGRSLTRRLVALVYRSSFVSPGCQSVCPSCRPQTPLRPEGRRPDSTGRSGARWARSGNTAHLRRAPPWPMVASGRPAQGPIARRASLWRAMVFGASFLLAFEIFG